ncbi:MAG: type II toxin-antitoxin system Phd/YefM family antitoxin [Oscillospiraceae bacterium]|jgi:prevent-host-death family protein|nr:type II toxin-antitoxin system Phd/YefM family antitoxin [Oscillospiraceae bacterium]
MISHFSLSAALDALVPISRFNKGEANKIFDEVRATGCKIVVKNNAPACVLLSPEQYKAMREELDDRYLLALALERMANDNGVSYTMEEILAEDGLTLADLDAMEDVELE